MMNDQKPEGKPLTRINAGLFLKSMYVHIYQWHEVMDGIDPNEAYGPFAEIVDQQETLMELLALFIEQYPVLLSLMGFDLPEGVAAFEVPNPLFEHKTKEDDTFSDDVHL